MVSGYEDKFLCYGLSLSRSSLRKNCADGLQWCPGQFQLMNSGKSMRQFFFLYFFHVRTNCCLYETKLTGRSSRRNNFYFLYFCQYLRCIDPGLTKGKRVKEIHSWHCKTVHSQLSLLPETIRWCYKAVPSNRNAVQFGIHLAKLKCNIKNLVPKLIVCKNLEKLKMYLLKNYDPLSINKRDVWCTCSIGLIDIFWETSLHVSTVFYFTSTAELSLSNDPIQSTPIYRPSEQQINKFPAVVCSCWRWRLFYSVTQSEEYIEKTSMILSLFDLAVLSLCTKYTSRRHVLGTSLIHVCVSLVGFGSARKNVKHMAIQHCTCNCVQVLWFQC